MCKVSVLLLLVAAAAVVLAEQSESCRKLMKGKHGHNKCCNDFKNIDKEFVKECLPPKPPSEMMGPPTGPPPCELEKCVAKKVGYLSADGKTDSEALRSYITKTLNPQAAAAVEKNCIDTDLNAYAPPDFCEFIKLKHCIEMHAMLNCADWETSDQCTEMKGNLEECAKSME